MNFWNHLLKQLHPRAPHQQAAPQPTPPPAASRLHLVYELLKEGKFSQALDEFINPAIAEFEESYGAIKERVYCPGGLVEQITCLGTAAMDKRAAVVADPAYAEAYHLKGYIAFERKDIAQAFESLGKAVELSPFHPLFLCELANVYQTTREWPKAMELYKQAEDYAPMHERQGDTTLRRRALRGRAFVLVELQNLDDAERLYRQCLELDPQDRIALRELHYIAHVRTAAPKQPKPTAPPGRGPVEPQDNSTPGGGPPPLT